MADTYNLIEIQPGDRGVIIKKYTREEYEADSTPSQRGFHSFWAVTTSEADQYDLEQKVEGIIEIMRRNPLNPVDDDPPGEPFESPPSPTPLIAPSPQMAPSAQRLKQKISQRAELSWNWHKLTKSQLKEAGKIADAQDWDRAFHFHQQHELTGEKFCCGGSKTLCKPAFLKAREDGII